MPNIPGYDAGAHRMQQLEQLTLADTRNRQPYALDPRDASLEQSAQANPATGAMMALGQTQPGSAGTAQALQAAQQLGGRGSFMGQIGQTGSQFGQDIGMLRSAAMGQGPSAAQALMRSGLDANARGARSLAAGARGGNLAGGLRAAIGAGSAANQQAIQQSAALRAQEQLSAMGQLSGANAALMQGQLGAQAAETARQAAFGQAGQGAAMADISGRQVQGGILQGAGGLYNQGQANAIGARGVQAGIARDAAADLEAQKRRALEAYNQQYGLRNQQRNIGMQNDFNPGQVIGAIGNIAGTAIGAAIPGMGAANAVAGAVAPPAAAPNPNVSDFGGRR